MADPALGRPGNASRWANPGGAHDRLVRWTKVALPSAVGVLIAVLAIAPFDRKSEVSFLLDKKKVDSAPERMRVEQARYVGTDNKGQQFTIIANRAVQPTSDAPIVDIMGMLARLNLEKGPLFVRANQGRYNLDNQEVSVEGPVRVVGGDGYKLATSDVTVDLKRRQLASAAPVEGSMRLGQFQAGHLSADLGKRTVVLDGGARLKIVQGTVR